MATKDLNNVKMSVQINGKECDFTIVRLQQTMYGHHIFDIDINYRSGKKNKAVWSESPAVILKELLGADITIHMSETDGAESEFKGIIKRVNVKGRDSNQGEVTIHGGSPTLFMTDDYSMNTFVDMDVASIVQETLSDIGLNIEHKLDPVRSNEIPFVYRYKESSYDFLRRLMASCGETFWYDGKKLLVGPPSKEDTDDVELSYMNDMLEMNISSGLGNYKIEQYDYDYTDDQVTHWGSPEGYKMDRFTSKAHIKSNEIFSDWTILPSKVPVRSANTFHMMGDGVTGEYYSKLADGSYITGKTTTCKVAVGKVLKLETDPSIQDSFTKQMGRFRVADVCHLYDNTKGEYINEFRGVNADVDNVPLRDIHYPTAMPEVAIVVDNADPKNMGRVKVQFAWQRLDDRPQDKTSGWIRVQTPDAGSSAVIDKNRGFFFVPEIGDQVMVGYEYGDPNRPFVTGSLFHVNNTKGIEGENMVKAIRTKSGHVLEFNDDESGSWGITIQDNEGNVIHLDTKGKEIRISAPEKITLVSKDILIAASNNLDLIAAQNANLQGDENVACRTKDIQMEIENEYNLNAKKVLEVSESVEIQSTKKDLILSSGKEVVNKSKSKKIRLS